jgi:hypothetical protein
VGFGAGAFAQDTAALESPYEASPSALGFFAMNVGRSSAVYGLQYHRWFDRFGVQVTGGGWYSPAGENNYPATMDYAFALQGMYAVYSNAFSDKIAGRLYLWGMLGHHGWMSTMNLTTTNPDGTTSYGVGSTGYLPALTSGVGIGIDITLFQHFSFPIEFGYSGQFINGMSVSPSIGGGIRYRY